ncbi:MAG: ExeM/NucH family extracellular endonuclease [Spongiibacteraceae bacterium]|nr:ExeM/NucH family extracellular endonuclease [Spongiibacteraceae bacterium]
MKPFYLGCLATSILLFPLAGQCATELFFSEYIEGSSNNKALEIANTTGSDVNLDDYEVYFYFNGNSTAARMITLTGTLANNDVFVLADNDATAEILTVADQTDTGSFFNGDDAIALLRSGTAVDIIGQIGFDPGSQWGSGETSTQNNTLQRLATRSDGDTNGSDAFDPAEQWQGFAQDTFSGLGSLNSDNCEDESCEPPVVDLQCGKPATLISTIQGDGASSPLVDSYQTIEAIVVGDFQGSKALSGFFVQEEEEDQDTNLSSSEGIFVYQGNSDIEVNEGDRVRIVGTVSETYGQTQISDVLGIAVCASGESITPTQITLPVNDLAVLESLEGMLVSTWQALSVADTYNLGRYGELQLSNGRLINPTQAAMPGADALAVSAANVLNRLILDDGSSISNPDPIAYPAPGLSANQTLRLGDTVSSFTGILSYAFSEYIMHPLSDVIFTPTNPRSSSPDLPEIGSLTIASFNLLNYFNGNGNDEFPTSRGASTASEFERQREKIINALVTMDADIVGLIEIQNNGFGENSAIQDLLNGLNDAGLHYNFVNPGINAIGTDQIMLGFIYKPESLALEGNVAILDTRVDPDFIDRHNRPSLAQTFREIATDEKFTFVINHLRSKGGSCESLSDPDLGDGQGACNLTRTKATQALVRWLASDPTSSGDEDFLLMGDFNAYAMEDPIRTIEEAGFINIARAFSDGEPVYSYVFSGEIGNLDHALASSALLNKITGVTHWHINADEPRALDYNEEYKSASQLIYLYDTHAYRASDHDPLMIELSLAPIFSKFDFNHDGKVNKKDLKQLLHHLGQQVTKRNVRYDLNNDQFIGVQDVFIWIFHKISITENN